MHPGGDGAASGESQVPDGGAQSQVPAGGAVARTGEHSATHQPPCHPGTGVSSSSGLFQCDTIRLSKFVINICKQFFADHLHLFADKIHFLANHIHGSGDFTFLLTIFTDLLTVHFLANHIHRYADCSISCKPYSQIY